MTTLNDRLDREPIPWKPEPGDRLVGEIIEMTERTSDFGVTYPWLTIEADGDEYSFHAFHTVASGEIRRLRPSVGDHIGIKYLGKPAGKDYEGYRIVLDRASSEEVATNEPF